MSEVKMTQQTDSYLATGSEWELEKQLFSSLNPVIPDPVFITRLEERLKKEPAIVLESGSFWKAYLVMASGLFGGVLLLWVLHVVYSVLKRVLSS
jgi:hypothetical protein